MIEFGKEIGRVIGFYGFAAGLLLASLQAFAQTLYFEDGTPLELGEGEEIYITDKPVFTITELEPFRDYVYIDDTLDSLEEYSEEWCSFWIKFVWDGVPTFDNIHTLERCAQVGVEPGK